MSALSNDLDLLDLLRCPVTGERLRSIEPERLVVLNQQIEAGTVVDRAGRAVEHPVQEAIINQSGTLLATVDDQIINLLAEELIPTDAIEGFSP